MKKDNFPSEKQLANCAGELQYASRSAYRPVITKFEQRALREGRKIWELHYQKLIAPL